MDSSEPPEVVLTADQPILAVSKPLALSAMVGASCMPSAASANWNQQKQPMPHFGVPECALTGFQRLPGYLWGLLNAALCVSVWRKQMSGPENIDLRACIMYQSEKRTLHGQMTYPTLNRVPSI